MFGRAFSTVLVHFIPAWNSFNCTTIFGVQSHYILFGEMGWKPNCFIWTLCQHAQGIPSWAALWKCYKGRRCWAKVCYSHETIYPIQIALCPCTKISRSFLRELQIQLGWRTWLTSIIIYLWAVIHYFGFSQWDQRKIQDASVPVLFQTKRMFPWWKLSVFTPSCVTRRLFSSAANSKFSGTNRTSGSWLYYWWYLSSHDMLS